MARGMTGRSFDELARELASGTLSRGKALRLMGAALVGGALASLPGAAWANDRCSQGQTRCGDRCVNLQKNENHCGSCSNRCGSNQTCCNGRCVNLQRNERHCGSCSIRCSEGSECVEGVCQGGGCPPVACEGGTVNPTMCECECPTNTALHQLSGKCVSTICPPDLVQFCANAPDELPEPSRLCCPSYDASGNSNGASCCFESWTCNVNHDQTNVSPCTPPT
jgi:hypothetical protein